MSLCGLPACFFKACPAQWCSPLMSLSEITSRYIPKVCLLAVLITTLSWVVREKTCWAQSRAQVTGLDDFYDPPWVRELVLTTKKNAQENTNNVMSLIHFLGRIWHLLKPLRQPNWLLLRLHTPGSALAVSGGAIWSKISLGRVPKKNPNVTTFWVSFLKPLRNLCCGYVGSKWGPEKVPKIELFETSPTLLKCNK